MASPGKRSTRKQGCRVIGITGSMGAGKSALMKLIAKRGWEILSADQLAREVVVPGSQGLARIVEAFGEEVLQKDGSLDRWKIRQLISGSKGHREKLESITHPLIQELFLRYKMEAEKKGAPYLFYEAPLLFEAGADKRVDFVICVTAPEPLRLDRVKARDGSNEKDLKKLMDSQMPEEEKVNRSDFEIPNDGSLDRLDRKLSEAMLAIESKFADGIS